MFPSVGLLSRVSCPYFVNGLCERPYCHFKHVKNHVSDGRAGYSTYGHSGANSWGSQPRGFEGSTSHNFDCASQSAVRPVWSGATGRLPSNYGEQIRPLPSHHGEPSHHGGPSHHGEPSSVCSYIPTPINAPVADMRLSAAQPGAARSFHDPNRLSGASHTGVTEKIECKAPYGYRPPKQAYVYEPTPISMLELKRTTQTVPKIFAAASSAASERSSQQPTVEETQASEDYRTGSRMRENNSMQRSLPFPPDHSSLITSHNNASKDEKKAELNANRIELEAEEQHDETKKKKKKKKQSENFLTKPTTQTEAHSEKDNCISGSDKVSGVHLRENSDEKIEKSLVAHPSPFKRTSTSGANECRSHSENENGAAMSDMANKPTHSGDGDEVGVLTKLQLTSCKMAIVSVGRLSEDALKRHTASMEIERDTSTDEIGTRDAFEGGAIYVDEADSDVEMIESGLPKEGGIIKECSSTTKSAKKRKFLEGFSKRIGSVKSANARPEKKAAKHHSKLCVEKDICTKKLEKSSSKSSLKQDAVFKGTSNDAPQKKAVGSLEAVPQGKESFKNKHDKRTNNWADVCSSEDASANIQHKDGKHSHRNKHKQKSLHTGKKKGRHDGSEPLRSSKKEKDKDVCNDGKSTPCVQVKVEGDVTPKLSKNAEKGSSASHNPKSKRKETPVRREKLDEETEAIFVEMFGEETDSNDGDPCKEVSDLKQKKSLGKKISQDTKKPPREAHKNSSPKVEYRDLFSKDSDTTESSDESDCVMYVSETKHGDDDGEVISLESASENEGETANEDCGDFEDGFDQSYDKHSSSSKAPLPSSSTSQRDSESAKCGMKRIAHENAVSEVAAKKPAFANLKPKRPSAQQSLQLRYQQVAETPEQTRREQPVCHSMLTSAGRHRLLSGSDAGGTSAPRTLRPGEKRQAHKIPPAVAQQKLERPVIKIDPRMYVAAKLRQTKLDSMVETCLGMYEDKEEAVQRAQQEEKEVYEKSRNPQVYKSAAANKITALRRESKDKAQRKNDPSSSSVKPQFPAIGVVSTKVMMEKLTGDLLYSNLKPHILSDEQLRENGYPLPDPDAPGKVKIAWNSLCTMPRVNGSLRPCARCGKSFSVVADKNGGRAGYGGDGINECQYHWARPNKMKIAHQIERIHRCCGGSSGGSDGCQIAKDHVHEVNKYTDCDGFVKTRRGDKNKSRIVVLALDCEMIYTVAGMELARVTVVDDKEKVVYDAVVKPSTPVIDYNTRFSGLKHADFLGVNTTLSTVQGHLLDRISSQTILIGHSLESDLIALKMMHHRVVDTSVVFPHKAGPPLKRALRNLMSDILQKLIQQDGAQGHDSAEDARSCMQLMKWQVVEDLKKQERKKDRK